MTDVAPQIEDAETPWTALKGVAAMRVAPARAPVVAEIAVPGSKSFSNRALIVAAMAEGQTRLSGLLRSDDTWWCSDALRRLGAKLDFEGDTAQIAGIGRSRPNSGRLHVGSAGTIARFLPPFLVAGEAGTWHVTASKQMSKRPVGPLFDALRAGGAEIDFLGEPNCFPAVFKGESFAGGSLTMSGNVSSQFISGVLLGAAQTRQGVDLTVTGGIVQSEYVRITLDVMAHFGAVATVDEGFEHFRVEPTGYKARDYVVEADASTSTYFAALAAVTRGRVTLTNLGRTTRQPDYGFLEILERLGCTVTRTDAQSTIEMKGPLKGGFSVDMRPLSDAALTLAAIAPYADGPITITNVAHIRHHESDRISAICTELAKAGIHVEEHEDGLTVHPGKPRFAVFDTYEDHRVAMALSVMAVAGDGAELKGPGCVSKTCPGFFDELKALGIETGAV